MPATIESLGIDKMSRDEQLILMSSIWKNIVRTAPPGSLLTDTQPADLRERIREADENPDDAVPCEEVHASIRKRLAL